MLTVYDSQGNSYRLTESIGSGGEGTVYRVPKDTETVAKIYHEPVEDEKAEKLRWMAANADEYLLKVAAWITEVLLAEPNGKVVGFLMPSVQAKEIHELYSLKSRRVHFPRATWQFLIHAAANVARAFYALHKTGHLMGDVNHGNCVVSANGTVKLIDCDSYGIYDGTRRYRCDVGVGTHLAPELQGKNLGDIERLPAHDNFGLAVIIFQLLFLGRHPFAGTYEGTEDKSIEECISELRFAYSKDAHRMQVRRPPGTISLKAVGERVAELFERAFLTDNRPKPREWVEALEDLSANLKQCSVHPGHHFYNELIICPFCEIETKSGLMLFPFIGDNNADGESNFNVFTVENLIASFTKAQNLPALPNTKTAILLPPSQNVELEKTSNRVRLFFFAAGECFVVLLIWAFAGSSLAIFIGIFIAVIFSTINNQSKNVLKGSLIYEKDSSLLDLKNIESEWAKGEAFLYEKDLNQINIKLADYKQLQHKTQQNIERLRGQVFRNELNLYLEKFKIVESGLFENDDKTMKKLRLGGVRDAGDIGNQFFRSIEAVDKDTKDKLWNWRKDLEKDFEFDQASIPEAERNRIFATFTETRRGIEREIELLLGKLRSSSLIVRQKQTDLRKKLDEATEKLSQVESDLQALGTNAAATILLFAIPFVITFFAANVFQTSNSDYPKPKTYSNGGIISDAPPVAPQRLGIGSSRMSSRPTIEISENITDEQLQQFAYSDRVEIADSLHSEAKELIEKSEYKKAEKKLRLATRFLNNYLPVFNELGNVLYLQGKYSESQKILFKYTEEISDQNTQTRSYIGRNYLALKNYEKAVEFLKSAAVEEPYSFDANYNLALAYKGTKNYSWAIDYFRKASSIAPEDSDINYQMAVCYKAMNNMQGVREQYEILRNKNKITADKLKREMGKSFTLEVSSPTREVSN